MEKGWVKVGSFANELSSEMCRLLLQEEGIVVVLMNKQDSSLKFGKIEILVKEGDVEKATEIVNTYNVEINED
ncbi:putative signal transducing protein [Sphingobacterium sp. LRF_L2]|uniref:putative signal transducing protein n=1 Tax=Sphingobacterium sp. LRF_L2 TaxID=3369421 RepID=UPI003F644C88